jgi:Lon protease-like protein
MFPLGTVLLPGEVLPLHVFEPRYREMVSFVLTQDGTFGVILIARGSEVGGGDERHGVGTFARIVEAAHFPDGRYALLVRGQSRLTVHSWETDDPYPRAVAEIRPSVPCETQHELVGGVTASVRRARALLSELGASFPYWDGVVDTTDPDEASWRLGSLAPFGAFDRQRVLEVDDPSERLGVIDDLCAEIASDAERMLADGAAEE